MNTKREDIRNIAIIAHVDHGKTTLVDELLKQSGIFRTNESVKERMMDSNDLERERGITILSKNTAINYKDTKINIIDTPGHADFGGEVERVLKMVSGVILVVDAFEGPMPQTKFVLKKALELQLPVIVAINKIDRPEARPEKVIDEVLDLFIELDASEEQIEFPVVFTSAKEGTSSIDMSKQEDNMEPLFESIIKHTPAPDVDAEGDLQVLISTIDYNEYLGRIGIGKVERGNIKTNQDAIIVNKEEESKNKKIRITKLYEFEGLSRVEVKEAKAGSIIAIAGVEDISIGDTICSIDNPEPLSFVTISEPTISMVFSVNNGPFAGREGKFVTSRQLRERLFKELHTDVSLKVEETESADSFIVSGRGELHLSILIETMRRQGYEFMVSKPKVLFKTVENKKYEPMERVTIDVPEEFMGSVIEKLGTRKGEMVNMVPSEGGYTRLEFSIPARGLIGYRSEFMTDTKGNGIMNSIFDGYEPFKGDIPTRSRGSLVSSEQGTSVTYGMYHVQDRGNLFIHPGVEVYEGMIVGMNSKTQDIDLNVCKKKHLTSMRASGSEEALRLVPPIIFSLEEALEFIEDDELVEITPENIRLRKKILDKTERKRANRK
ncbi:translational GTPase TypA [Clostridium sp. D2Q-11]|uniref:Large ribosomal subunit assembly factor BipA n=1 Tax=Anaeromonas frigoriresistens TaxID=2683708 RepID=A0A942UYN1_9FIRM|nr:translational GTPase TypA [Anaeromonas frigoriresistens]MBS4540025.1 translational GTPase TypA [Anaeromonas frigoriresistens]